MPLSQETMVLGPFTLGAWIYDCEQLQSIVRLRKTRPAFEFTITVGRTAAEVLTNGLAILPGDIGKRIGETVSKAAPEFSGTILVLTTAEPVREICDAETGKQTVGWDYVVLVLIRGKIKTAAAEAELKIDLPFAGEGARRQCECNRKLKLEDISFVDDASNFVRVVSDASREETSILVPPNELEQLATIKFGRALPFRAGVETTEVAREERPVIASVRPGDLELPPLCGPDAV